VVGEDDIEDDWVDPVTAPSPPGPAARSENKEWRKKPVPMTSVLYLFPVSVEVGRGNPARDGGRTESRSVCGIL